MHASNFCKGYTVYRSIRIFIGGIHINYFPHIANEQNSSDGDHDLFRVQDDFYVVTQECSYGKSFLINSMYWPLKVQKGYQMFFLLRNLILNLLSLKLIGLCTGWILKQTLIIRKLWWYNWSKGNSNWQWRRRWRLPLNLQSWRNDRIESCMPIFKMLSTFSSEGGYPNFQKLQRCIGEWVRHTPKHE